MRSIHVPILVKLSLSKRYVSCSFHDRKYFYCTILIYFFKDKTKYIIEFEFLGFLWGIFFKLSTNVKKTIVYITI